MNLRIDSLGKNSAFVDSLARLYLFTCILGLWNRHRCFRLYRLLVRLSLPAGILNNKRGMYRIQRLIRDRIWILV